MIDKELHHLTLLPGAGRHRQEPLEQVEAQGIPSQLPGAAKLAGDGLKALRRAGSHGECARRYAAALEALLAHARHSRSVQRQGWSERLRVQTTQCRLGSAFQRQHAAAEHASTPARLVKTLASRSPGRGLIRGLRIPFPAHPQRAASSAAMRPAISGETSISSFSDSQ